MNMDSLLATMRGQVAGLQNAGAFLGGVNIHLSDNLPCKQEWRQVRFPKSKRKRIRKKWAKNKRRNWAMVDVEPVIMQINGAIYCNQLGYDQIKRGVASFNEQLP